jgi:2-dehydro-3-deoxyphosphogalactonate aldolase
MSIDTLLAGGVPAVVAILRGVRPDEAVALGTALIDSGIKLIEVPLNSPQPLQSIARLHEAFGSHALVGAGTVLSMHDVDAVASVGGQLIVAPNSDAAVIARSIERGLEPMPGFFSPSEAFGAIAAGARHLKLFPARTAGLDHLAALREVMPASVRVWAVGGVDASNLGEWLGKGAAGIGAGSALYRPGMTPEALGARARELVAAWKDFTTTGTTRLSVEHPTRPV